MWNFTDEYKAAMARRPINLDALWMIAERGIARLKAISAGEPEPLFTAEDYMSFYTIIYEILSRSNPTQLNRMYDNYRKIFEDHLSSTALPSLLQQNHGELLLRDFSGRWASHKRMASSMSHVFHYFEQHYIPLNHLAGLNEVAFACFRDLVYVKVKERVRDAALWLIDGERDGQRIDGALVKNAVDAFVEIGNYEDDFETPMIERAADYYTQKASRWALQGDECLKVEKYRVCPYLHPSSEAKLLDRVRQELLFAQTAQLQL